MLRRDGEMETVWGTCVAMDGRAVLFRGPSGSGKSDLALRVVKSGGKLIADDRTRLIREEDQVLATSTDRHVGQIEVRGVGIVTVDHLQRAPLALVVDMMPPDQVDRYPDPRHCTYLDVDVPLLGLAPFEVSAVVKIEVALFGQLWP